MAGGTFDKSVGKIRPGTYINFESANQQLLGTSDRGTVLIPLVNHSYGPEKEFITISGDSADSAYEKLGYSVYDDNPSMLLIREAFKCAQTVIVYIVKGGAKASGSGGGLTAEAKYGGSRGNDKRLLMLRLPHGLREQTLLPAILKVIPRKFMSELKRLPLRKPMSRLLQLFKTASFSFRILKAEMLLWNMILTVSLLLQKRKINLTVKTEC